MPEDQDQLYEVNEQLPDHHYRTEIPNIVFELGLDPQEYMLYSIIKRIAGDGGRCWCSANEMRKKAHNMSKEKYFATLDKLESKFSLINSPLIKITRRTKSDGSRDTNIITIVNIWPQNGAFFKKGGGSPNELGVVRQTNQGSSPGEHKEELSEEELSKRTTNYYSKNVPDETEKVSQSVSSSFLNLDISKEKQLWASQNFTETQIIDAVDKTLAFEKRASDEAVFVDILKYPEKWNKHPKQEKNKIRHENQILLEKYRYLDYKTIHGWSIIVGETYIEFGYGSVQKIMDIDDVDFEDKLFKQLVLLQIVK